MNIESQMNSGMNGMKAMNGASRKNMAGGRRRNRKNKSCGGNRKNKTHGGNRKNMLGGRRRKTKKNRRN